MNKFVSLPLDKMMNRENPISRIERLEGRVIYPSISVGNLAEISNDLGEQVAGKYSIVDQATGQILGTLDEKGIVLLAQGSLFNNRGYKFEDAEGESAGGLYCYVDSSNNTWLRLRAHGQNNPPTAHTYIDAVGTSYAFAHLTADSGSSTDAAPDFYVEQSSTGNRAVFDNFGEIDFNNAAILNFTGGGGAFVQETSTQTGAVATSASTDTIPSDDTIPQNTEGKEFMTLAITPTSATNKLRITTTFYVAASAADVVTVALFQDTTANALAAGFFYASVAGDIATLTFTHTMDAGTTSATTFKVRAGTNGGATLTFNGSGGARKLGGVLASSIVIREVTP